MSVRSRAARERQTRIARLARQLRRQHGAVRYSEVTRLAVCAGMKTSHDEVRTVMARLRLHR